MSNLKINLYIIGAQKTGTTSLYNYIKQHPDICFSDIKELIYFVDDTVYAKGETYLHSFFSKYKNQKIVATSYVHMLSSEICISRVYEYNKDSKFIVLLRDPAERAFSAFNYAKQMGWEEPNAQFDEIIAQEISGKYPPKNHERLIDLSYVKNGLYAEALEKWTKVFDKNQFLILKDKDLSSNPKEILNRIFSFLQISNQEADLIDTSKRFNEASKIKIRFIHKLLFDKKAPIKRIGAILFPIKLKRFVRAQLMPKIVSWNSRKIEKVQMSHSSKNILLDFYSGDLDKLEKEFGVKL